VDDLPVHARESEMTESPVMSDDDKWRIIGPIIGIVGLVLIGGFVVLAICM